MKKIAIILTILMISIGFLSGCFEEDTESTVYIKIHDYNIYDKTIYIKDLDRDLEADEGNIFLIANITLTSTDMEVFISAGLFEIHTTNGRVYEGDKIEPNLPDSIMYRSKLSFWLLFEIPDNVILEKMAYWWSNIHGQSAYGETYF